MLIDSPPKKTLSFIFLYSYIHFQNYMPMSANYQFITPSGQNPNLFLYSEKVGLNFKNVSLCHLAYYGFSEEECCRTLIPDSDVLSSDSSSTNTLLQRPVPSLHLAFPALGSCNAVLQQQTPETCRFSSSRLLRARTYSNIQALQYRLVCRTLANTFSLGGLIAK